LVEKDKLKVAKITCFDLGDVAEAHKLIESGKSIGKIILKPRKQK